jgi:hypothetical protein
MTLKYNKQLNDVIDQSTKNVDQLFGLFTTAQKQVEKLANLIIDESTETIQKVGKEFVAAGGKIGDETVSVAQNSLDNTVEVAFSQAS